MPERLIDHSRHSNLQKIGKKNISNAAQNPRAVDPSFFGDLRSRAQRPVTRTCRLGVAPNASSIIVHRYHQWRNKPALVLLPFSETWRVVSRRTSSESFCTSLFSTL
jgi:hypothetical protein